jgi:ABC-type sugar transport system substrate-binding protein
MMTASRVTRNSALFTIACLLGMSAALLSSGCRNRSVSVAVIPRTTGTPFWESFHQGVVETSSPLGIHVYWNAPVHESDADKQLRLLAACSKQGYQGFILAPDLTLTFRSAVQGLMERKIPTVIVNDKLGPDPGPYLSYVMNNENEGARAAAEYTVNLLHRRGNIAILGIAAQREMYAQRAIAVERELRQRAPDIHVVSRQADDALVAHQQYLVQEILKGKDHIDAILALSSISTRGAIEAMLADGQHSIPIIGFDQETAAPLRSGYLRAVVVEDTHQIGELAMHNLIRQMQGNPVAGYTYVSPVLITKENLDANQDRFFSGGTHYAWRKQ